MADQFWPMSRQLAVYAAIVCGAFILVLLLIPGAELYFERYFLGVNPLIVVMAAGIVGAVCLQWLRSHFGFEILRRGATLRGIVWSAILATAMAIAIVIADLFIRYPENTNVPVPQALAFYPAVGFVAEIVFHVLPLTLILLVLWPLRRRIRKDHLVWFSIIFVAASEPTFQVLFSGETLKWADMYTWLHVFAFALLQLYVFRRFDFTSMYVFRLIYYAYWHVIWGVLRLEVLF